MPISVMLPCYNSLRLYKSKQTLAQADSALLVIGLGRGLIFTFPDMWLKMLLFLTILFMMEDIWRKRPSLLLIASSDPVSQRPSPMMLLIRVDWANEGRGESYISLNHTVNNSHTECSVFTYLVSADAADNCDEFSRLAVHRHFFAPLFPSPVWNPAAHEDSDFLLGFFLNGLWHPLQ